MHALECFVTTDGQMWRKGERFSK